LADGHRLPRNGHYRRRRRNGFLRARATPGRHNTSGTVTGRDVRPERSLARAPARRNWIVGVYDAHGNSSCTRSGNSHQFVTAAASAPTVVVVVAAYRFPKVAAAAWHSNPVCSPLAGR